MVFFCNIDDYAQLTHALQVFLSPFLQNGDRLRLLLAKNKWDVFFSPFLQKEDRLRLLFCISPSLFTKERQIKVFACKKQTACIFFSLFTKGRQIKVFACKNLNQRDFLPKPLLPNALSHVRVM